MLPITFLLMILSVHSMHASNVPRRTKANVSGGDSNIILWPDAKIPYTLASNFTAKDLATIADVMKVFKDNTCIRFVPRSDEVPYLNIVNEGCCSASNLGVPDFDDHATVSVMSPAGFFGGVFHELMHIAGFTHQQNRFDRDKAIFINYAYVEKGNEWAVDKDSPADNAWHGLNIPYDTQSVMHYGYDVPVFNAFDGGIVQAPDYVDPCTSKLDFLSLNRLYNCDPNDCFDSPDCNNGQGPYEWTVSNKGTFVYAVNCDFSGPNITSSSAASHELCRGLCMANPNCTHTSWNIATKMCYMKKSTSWYPLAIPIRPLLGSVCGFVNYQLGRYNWFFGNNGRFLYAQDCDHYGDDIATGNANSYEKCGALCLVNPSCNYIAFNSYGCFLKNVTIPSQYPLSMKAGDFKGSVCGYKYNKP